MEKGESLERPRLQSSSAVNENSEGVVRNRDVAKDLKYLTSMGLNLTLWTLSDPHVNDRSGSVLCSSQMSTC